MQAGKPYAINTLSEKERLEHYPGSVCASKCSIISKTLLQRVSKTDPG